MANTLVIDFKDPLMALEGLPKGAYSMIYLQCPVQVDNSITAHRSSHARPRRAEFQSKEDWSQAVREHRELLRVEAEKEYASYVSHLVESSSTLLEEEGTLCFVARSRMSEYCNYQMILESFFRSIVQISLPLRSRGDLRGMPEHIIIYCCKKQDGAFFEWLKEPAPAERFNMVDDNGRRYCRTSLMAPDADNRRPSLHYEWRGVKPAEGMSWRYSRERLQDEYDKGRIEVVNGRACGRRYHDECFVTVPSTWENVARRHELISVENMNRLFKMFTEPGQRVLCPFEHDGVFSYCANDSGLVWTSFYEPIDERVSYVSMIPDDDYELSEDLRSESTAKYRSIVKSSAELDDMSRQMHELQEAVSSMQQTLESQGKGDVEIVDAISSKIEDMVPRANVKSCIPDLMEWLKPHWRKLEPESHGFLPVGEFIRRELDAQADDGTDYAPAMIEYCKALETELFTKMFRAYVQDLIDNNVDVRREFSDDFDRRSETHVFAEFVERCIRRDRHRPYNWRFELGKMARVLTSVLRHDGDPQGIFADFEDFLGTAFDEGFFGSDFSDRLTDIANLRNECAHRSLMVKDKAELTRELIRQKLNSILSYYN